MRITNIWYRFCDEYISISDPIEIVKETDKTFIGINGERISKSQVGTPMLKSKTYYPFVDLYMIDADETTLRERLASWFRDKGLEIIEGGLA